MFNRLIESSSHVRELQRRGSFFILTTITYALLFVTAGIVSIHAYDAQMKDQSLDVSILTFPANLPEPVPQPNPGHPGEAGGSASNVAPRPTRPILIDSTNNPINVPPKVGVVAPDVPLAPPGADLAVRVADPPGSGQQGSPRGAGSESGGGTFVRNLDPPPVPATTPTPAPRIFRSARVLNSEALSLPKPPYPPMAITLRLQGVVSVQVLINESGKVISAKAVSGPAIFVREAEKAALQAVFSPTRIGDQAVKVSGTITYNFVLER